MTLVSDPFSLALEGTVKVFIVQVGGAKAKLTSSSFLNTRCRQRRTHAVDPIDGNAAIFAAIETQEGGFKVRGLRRLDGRTVKGDRCAQIFGLERRYNLDKPEAIFLQS